MPVRVNSNIELLKNIVEYLGSIGWGTNTILIFMSIKDGNLRELFRRFPSARFHRSVFKTLLGQMLEALDYLAFREHCHRDGKPQNILYTCVNDSQYRYQLTDFSLAQHQQFATTFCGTQLYMALEMMTREYRRTPKIDVWSLFVTIADVAEPNGLGTGIRYFDNVLKRIKAATTRFTELSPMACVNPEMRASAAQMLVKLYNGEGLSTPKSQVRRINESKEAGGAKAPAPPRGIQKRRLSSGSQNPSAKIKRQMLLEITPKPDNIAESTQQKGPLVNLGPGRQTPLQFRRSSGVGAKLIKVPGAFPNLG